MTCAFKNARLLPDYCCCLNNGGNLIIFRIIISPPFTTIAGLNGTCQWLGLPGHRALHQWTSRYRVTLRPWFTGRHLILKRILLPALLRQQQPSSSNLAFLRAHVRFWCVVVGCVSKSLAVSLNICSNLVQNITFFFFSEYFKGFAWFTDLVRPNLTVRSAARTHLRHTVPWQ